MTFIVTFGAGYSAGTALLVDGELSGESLGAFLTRPRSISLTGSGSSKAAVRKKAVKKRGRGVVRSMIVRPVRQRRSTGATADAQASSSAGPIKASCGDGLVLMAEKCDDKNLTNGDGCASNCTIEGGFVCNSAQPSLCWSVCGDGVIASNERCDDGNKTAGDGCSGACKIELGYVCKNTPSFCEPTPYCGDGVKASTEQCDDGNSTSGDGCHACKTE